jgi:hypothetical protein
MGNTAHAPQRRDSDMTDITHTEQPANMTQTEREDASFTGGLETFKRIQQERDSYLQQCQNWERSYAIIQGENEMMRQRIVDLERRAAFYMRHSTELHTGMVNVNDLLKVSVEKAGPYVSGGLGLVEVMKVFDTAMQRAKAAAYKPSNAAPERVSLGDDDGAEVPRFLTNKKDPLAAVEAAVAEAMSQDQHHQKEEGNDH